MTTTNTLNVNGEVYDEFPMQSGLTVGDLLHFLGQFPDLDQQIGWYLIAEDATPYVGLHPDTSYGTEDPPWPMIVTSFVPYDEVP